jgi:hypothetical protein
MPGKELGARRVDAPDLYRLKGSLPIPNHTMPGWEAQLGRMKMGFREEGELRYC